MTLSVSPVAAFKDNYIWVLSCNDNKGVYVVDPGDAQPVLDFLEKNQLTLLGILITHHHWDHTSGIDELCSHYQIPVYGPKSNEISAITHHVGEGDRIKVGNIDCLVLEIPGHTLDHIAYYTTPKGQNPALFCGDTLFAAGCGRLFEGSPEQMHHSLQKLAALPDNTLVYCTHEYTVANLHFACHIEPQNLAIEQRFKQAKAQRERHLPTLPSTIKLEKQTNPFLHCNNQELRHRLKEFNNEIPNTDIETFAVLRRWKDSF